MTRDDAKRFQVAMTILAETFGRELSELTFEAYFHALDDLSIEQFERAAREAQRSETFMPTPVKLREFAGHGKGEDLAVMAWESVLKAIRSCGQYGSPDFEDVAVAATIRGLGGWQRLCDTPREELHSFVRAAFVKAYPIWRARNGGDCDSRLIGTFESDTKAITSARRIPAPYLAKSERAAIEERRVAIEANGNGEAKS